MKQATKRFLSLIISLVLISAAFVIYFNLIQPAYGEAHDIKANLISRQDFVANQKTAIQDVKNLIESYRGEGQLQQVVSLALPLTPDSAGGLAQLNGIIQNNKLILQALTAAVPSLQNMGDSGAAGAGSLVRPIGVINLQLRLFGSYENFKSFLKNLESNIRIFDVQRLNFQSAGKPTDDAYVYDLTIVTYYQAQ